MQRIRHVEIAVEHLHAAGLHETADRLTRELDEKRALLRQPGSGPNRPDSSLGYRRLAGQLERVQAQLQEVRRNLNEMQERLDQLAGERR